MSVVPWQLIAVEDAEASSIDLKTGATLLGRGQQATPGLNEDSVSRVAARIQVAPGRIQFTSMAHPGFLRITSAETGTVRKLVRGQAVLLAMGDMVDMASTTNLDAPPSRFTYMLAEHIVESDIQGIHTQGRTVTGNISSCKEESSQSAARPEALTLPMQQTADRPAGIAQASPKLVATAASCPDGHSPTPLSAQDALSPRHAELPGVAANIAQASALPPVDQALSPQANRQTSPHRQPQPANAVTSQPGVAYPASGFQSHMSPTMPSTSSTIDSMPNASDEPVQVPAQCEPQHPGTAAEDAVQRLHDSNTKSDKAMVHEECAPDAAKDINDNQQSPNQRIAAQCATSPSAPNRQQQSGEDAAMADTAPSSLSPQTGALVKAEPQSDTPMQEVDGRSAADIFEQTVQDCKKVVEEASSILLNKEAEGAGGGHTSRIAASERATMWHNELQGLLNRCKMPQLYIGVLGDTGAGKSSTINCLLGEENVLPVNGMRACTACVVEISYIPSSIYEGTVECMTRGEWTAQATSLWNDLIDERGRLKICRDAERRLNTSSIEGAAQATLETVYGPRSFRRSGMTLEKLLEVNNKITGLLGRTINIREHTVKAFRKRIGEYVDSHNKKDEIQAWPLVKVCKLRHNWQVLSTGAVVVDLPGVRDANAARGAVAEKYMKSCNAVWIVADITRAVDNRTAKDLLGENFRRQMLMDGQYGSITFICTKTDVIQVSETVRSFSQDGSGKAKLCEAAGVPLEQYEAAQQRVDERQSEYNKHEAVKRRCKRKAKPLNRALAGLRRRLQNCREKIKRLEASANGEHPYQLVPSDSESESEFDSGDESAESGAEYAPGDKRKSSRVNAGGSKRRRRSPLSDAGSDSDLELGGLSDDNSDESSEEEEEEVAVPVPKKGSGPSTLPELQTYAEELEAAIAEKSAIVKTLKSDHREAEIQSDRALRKLTQVQLAVTEICGRARNSYSKGVLKKDFKDGLLEMEETAADVELDAEDLQDPGRPSGSGAQQQRRAQQGQESELPVFCVSAKDCQRIEGRTSKDGFPSAFTKIEYTEMPQLRKHVHHVTEQGRLHAARSLASGLAQFIKTTAATLVHHGTINAELQGACHAAFKIELAKLLSAAQQSLVTWKDSLEYECTKGTISPRLHSGADVARNRAVATQAKWGAHKREGGLYWSTYKATVRPARNGVYKSNSAGEINFNADLARPILDGISMEWEALFGTTIIKRLKQYKKDLVDHVSTCLAAVKASLVKLGVDENRLHRIVAEVQAQEVRKCTDVLTQIAEDIQTWQRDMSRDVIAPTVQEAMTEGYAACCAEAGPGQFERMRRLMKSTVERYKSSMFAEAASKLEGAMKEMVATAAESLGKAQEGLAARVADTFTILWERPSCSIKERKAALVSLQGLAGQMQHICRGAGAGVLELSLPEEEEDDEEQQQAGITPNARGKHAAVKAEDEEDEDMEEEDEEDSDQNIGEDDDEDDEEGEDEEDKDDEEEADGGFWKAWRDSVRMRSDVNSEEDEDSEDEGLNEAGVNAEMEVDDEFDEDGEDEGDEELDGELEEDGEDEGEEDEGLDYSPATRAHLGMPGPAVLDFGPVIGGRSAADPPFTTPRPLIKSEPKDDSTPGAAGGPFSAQANPPPMINLSAKQGNGPARSAVPYSNAALPMSAGFKSAAQHTFLQQDKAEGTRHSTGSLLPFASQAGHHPCSFFSGVPQPIRGPFAGTVFDPATRSIRIVEDPQPASQASTGQPAVTEAKAEGTTGGAVVEDSGMAVSPSDVTDVQLAAVKAAAEDKQAAEQFAAGALQSPTAEPLCHPGLAPKDIIKIEEDAAAEAFLKQGLAADMVQGSTADAAVPAAAANAADETAPASADNTTVAIKAEPIEADMGDRADEQPDVQLSNADRSVLQATMPAGSASGSGVKAASTARKSGSQSWLGKAGGLLGRWTVPVKVKKERKSGQRGVADTIDLT